MTLRHTQLTANLTAAIVLLSAVALMSTTAHADLLSHWKFDETGGTTATSVEGYVGNLQAQGGALPTFVAGKFGNALYTDGVGPNNATPQMEAILSGTNAAGLNFGTGDFSIAFWLKTDPNYSIVSADTMIQIGRDVQAERLFLPVRNAQGSSYNGIYQRHVNSDFSVSSGDLQPSSDQSALVTDDAWHHYAFVTDRDDFSKVYIDGVEVGSKNLTGDTIDQSGAINTLDVSGDQFNGAIDDLRFYNEVLDQSQIDALQVPEPGSLSLLLLGLVSLVIRRRRRR